MTSEPYVARPKNGLGELADRVEAATGPDRELDREVARALGLPWDYAADWGPRGHDQPTAFPYTASLDAAMSLVPEGAGLSISRYWIASKDGPVWSAGIGTGGVPGNPRQVFDCYDAATPALALTAAALRARALDGAQT